MREEDLYRLAEELGRALRKHDMMLVTAESCTGGWVGEAVTSVAGSSRWFDRGFITYTNESKQDMLGVSMRTLAHAGAVSEEAVREMAAGALKNSRAQVAVAISGIAGPGGGSQEKPVGTVWFAWAFAGGKMDSERRQFAGSRREVRGQAVETALRGVLARLNAQPDDRFAVKEARVSKQDLLTTLRQAKDAHLAWRDHAELLIKGLEFSLAKAPVEQENCEFCKWYKGQEAFSCLDNYELVDETHKMLHAIYYEIYTLIQQHDFKGAEDRLEDLTKASNALLDSLDLLEGEIMALPNGGI